MYGSDAIGGAVNIITKKGGSKPFQASVSAGYDSSGNGRTLSGSIYGAVNGWEYRVSGAIEEYDDLDTPVGKVDNTNFSSRSASAYLAYNVNSDIKLGASLDTFDLETYSANQIGVMQGSMRNFAVDVPEWKRTKGAVFYEHKNITDNFVRLRLDAFLQQTDKDMHNLVMPNMGSPSSSMEINNWADNELKQTSLSVQTDWQFGESYFILGYEYSHETLDASTTQIQNMMVATPMVSMNRYSSGTEWYDAEQNRHSVYLSGETPVLDAVTLNYGVRYTWVDGENTTTGGNTTTTTVLMNGRPMLSTTETLDSNSHTSASDGKAVFNFGAVWRPIDHLSLRATWAQGYRFPLMQEMFIDSVMGGEYTYANPNLKPETSDNFEVGARWDGRWASVDAALFYNKTDDYITSVTIGEVNGVDASEMQNVSEATTFGLELAVNMRPFECGVAPYTSLTIMRRKYEENGISTYDSGTPDFTARYGVKWNGSYNGLGLRSDLFALTRTSTDEKSLDPSSPGTTHLGGATTYNLTAGISFGPKKQYGLDVGLYNITDKLYTKSGAIYEAGRFFTLKFNAKF